MNRLITAISNVFFGILIVMVASMSFFLIQYKISGGEPKIAGHLMYIVLSDSMNPTFNTGSLVFVKPMNPAEIKKGDIITYKGSGDSKDLTTHRVFDVETNESGSIQFTTKGDANKVNDPVPVPAETLMGKVNFSVPYLGYIISFGQTKQGLLSLIIIPGGLLIISEVYRLYKNILKYMEQKNVGNKAA